MFDLYIILSQIGTFHFMSRQIRRSSSSPFPTATTEINVGGNVNKLMLITTIIQPRFVSYNNRIFTTGPPAISFGKESKTAQSVFEKIIIHLLKIKYASS